MARTPHVAIVIVPRERFSYTQNSLESFFANTPGAFSLVYVDGGSPRYVRRYLEAASRERGFTLIRTPNYLSPNVARNMGLAHTPASSEYVAFLDNDILFAPGWLEALVQCADETGAWAVGPLYFERGFDTIHMAGGDLSTERQGGRLVYQERHRWPHQPVAALTKPLSRERVDVLEFHAFLVRRSAFARIGPFDEGMLSTRDGIDWCLTVARAGGAVFIEPRAAVSYMKPDSLRWSDLGFWSTRWSERWSTASLEHFARKWDAAIEDGQLDWVREHRRLFLGPAWPRIRKLLGRFGEAAEGRILFPAERVLNRLLFRVPPSHEA